MAAITYKIKRGDSLWSICASKEWGPKISGNTINAKIDTLVKLNNIKNRNLIITGHTLILSSSGGSSSGGSSTPAASIGKKVTNIRIGLEASNDTTSKNRAVYADWSYSREHLAKYKYRWEQYIIQNGVHAGWVLGSEGETTSFEERYCYSTFTADNNATGVRFRVLPVAATYERETKDGKGNTIKEDVPYWTDAEWSDVAHKYEFSENPPLTPPTPKVEINNDTSGSKLELTASISNINATELDATSVRFNIVQDNTTSIHASSPVSIVKASNYVSYKYTVQPGHIYTVRALSVSSKNKESGWSDFSEEAGTRPSAPSAPPRCERKKRSDGTISAYLEWNAVANADSYKIEYTTIESDFDNAPDNIQEKTTEGARTSIEITDVESGNEYFFRVKAVNEYGESLPTASTVLPIGSPPAAPTTYSSSESAFVGETMELNWIHNPTDNSKQSLAELSLKIDDANWVSYIFENTTDANTTGEYADRSQTFTYGTGVSYKGTLYVELNTNHANLRNAKIQWKVRTAGVTDSFSDTAWSVERTIYIYEKPTLTLSMTSDLAGTGALITTLESFPFYIRGTVNLEDHKIQKPVGYHLQIVSNEYYVTVDDVGRTKTINPGDAVYSKYFDTSDTLIVEMSANNVDLESGITYTVYCSVDMSTGLTVDNQHEFGVSWVDVSYAIDAEIVVDPDAYTALISPRCIEKIPVESDSGEIEYEDGDLVENVTLAVYRREYDGSYKEISSNIPNNGTAVTDPHPALDYARYRLVAKDTQTGALSFYDMAGYPVNCSSVIIQWDEEWSSFDVTGEHAVEGPMWSGSLLMLKYNIKTSDKRKRDVSLVNYAGREHPVSYYGTQIEENPSWSMEIPSDDKETIYALRRLSMWTGDAYVREPSGVGYWANVIVSFNQSYDSVKIPVTLDITRVEGGV